MNEAQEATTKRLCDVGPPSSLATRTVFYKKQKELGILCHRPYPEYVGRPVKWYHRIFRNFIKDCIDQAVEPSKDFYNNSFELCNVMARMYNNEKGRCAALNSVLQLFGMCLVEIKLDDGSSNDGICGKEFKIPNPQYPTTFRTETAATIIREVKNEIEAATCDPFLQAVFSYSKFWNQEKFEILRKKSNSPSMLFCLAGP